MLAKQLVGTVVSDKMNKTVVVAVQRRVKHPKYGKITVRTKRYKVHDEHNCCQAGDRVRIYETRPLSKTKRWAVDEILTNERHTTIDYYSKAQVPQLGLMIHRDIKASVPKKVYVGRQFSLEIKLQHPGLQRDKPSVVEMSNHSPINLAARVCVSKSDFDIDENLKNVQISSDSRIDTVTFSLIPREEGPKLIELDLFQDSRYLGSQKFEMDALKD
ncbi:MAG: 30S ribosomal protein S17 [Symploca sp. SIO2B6]|nr:30S ribosomal protein S17 [Symploca sp. SIO2B6]